MATPSSQPPAPYPMFSALESLLSEKRLERYLTAMNGNQHGAVQLYRWGMAMSGAVHEALFTTEVVLRNAMDAQLRAWNATQKDATGRRHSSNWLVDPSKLLVRLVRRDSLTEAHRRARQAVAAYHRPVSHDDVLTQVSFGTWRFLLPDRDPGRQLLWREALQAAFPHLAMPPAQFVACVDGIYKLRNRCAHMESLLDSKNVRRQYRNMRAALHAVDPVADQWFASTQRVTSLLRDRPPAPVTP